MQHVRRQADLEDERDISERRGYERRAAGGRAVPGGSGGAEQEGQDEQAGGASDSTQARKVPLISRHDVDNCVYTHAQTIINVVTYVSFDCFVVDIVDVVIDKRVYDC